MSLEIGFLIKKIVSAILMPLPIGLIVGVLGLLYLYQNRIKKAKIFLSFSLLWITIVTSAPFSNLLLEPLEERYERVEEIPKDIKYILVLGGDIEKRGWEALRLYFKIPNVKIITSGYNPYGAVTEAVKSAKLLESSGIPKEDILVRCKPKDTSEEAKEVKKIVGKKPFILVTSASHMSRAVSIFKKEGLNFIVSPYKGQSDNRVITSPQGKELQKTDKAWHEYLGILWYSLRN